MKRGERKREMNISKQDQNEFSIYLNRQEMILLRQGLHCLYTVVDDDNINKIIKITHDLIDRNLT